MYAHGLRRRTSDACLRSLGAVVPPELFAYTMRAGCTRHPVIRAVCKAARMVSRTIMGYVVLWEMKTLRPSSLDRARTALIGEPLGPNVVCSWSSTSCQTGKCGTSRGGLFRRWW